MAQGINKVTNYLFIAAVKVGKQWMHCAEDQERSCLSSTCQPESAALQDQFAAQMASLSTDAFDSFRSVSD